MQEQQTVEAMTEWCNTAEWDCLRRVQQLIQSTADGLIQFLSQESLVLVFVVVVVAGIIIWKSVWRIQVISRK